MNNAKLLAACLLLVCSVPTHAAEVRGQIYQVGVDVDANGHVAATQVDADVPADIANVLASAVEQWAFVPATRNGEPVRAHTFVHAKLQVAPDANGHSTVRVYFLGNGPKLDLTDAVPRYPMEAARARQQAFALVDATVQPDGSLADVTVRSRATSWPLPRAFSESVLAAAMHWHAIPERVDGQAVATHVQIPIEFTLSGLPLPGKQARALREAFRREAAAATASGHGTFQSDQPVAVDSPLQPRTLAANAH